MSFYPMMCSRHKEHNEECGVCRNFDHALKQRLSSYTIHPQQHVSIVAPQVRAWMNTVFPVT